MKKIDFLILGLYTLVTLVICLFILEISRSKRAAYELVEKLQTSDEIRSVVIEDIVGNFSVEYVENSLGGDKKWSIRGTIDYRFLDCFDIKDDVLYITDADLSEMENNYIQAFQVEMGLPVEIINSPGVFMSSKTYEELSEE